MLIYGLEILDNVLVLVVVALVAPKVNAGHYKSVGSSPELRFERTLIATCSVSIAICTSQAISKIIELI